MHWTDEQEDVLWEYGNLGAEKCAEIISRRYHVYRSASATQRHASRLGIPLTRYMVCPQCGAKVAKLNRISKLCVNCNRKQLTQNALARHAQIVKECRRNGTEDERLLREYNAAKKSCQRARESAVSVDLSE